MTYQPGFGSPQPRRQLAGLFAANRRVTRDESIGEEGSTNGTNHFQASSTRNHRVSELAYKNNYIFEGGDRWDKRLGEFKIREDNDEGRQSFVRRMSYEPNLSKRKQRAVHITTDPAEFLDLYK